MSRLVPAVRIRPAGRAGILEREVLTAGGGPGKMGGWTCG